MIYDTLEAALAKDPHKKGVALFCVVSDDFGDCTYVWARSKRDAIGQVAENDYRAHKYQAGAEVESDIEAPTIQEELF